jgi:magnesium transporter
MEQVVARYLSPSAPRYLGSRARQTGKTGAQAPDLQDTLRRIGRVGDLASKARDSLLGLNRIAVFPNAQADMEGGHQGP